VSVPKNCIECPYHKMQMKVGQVLKVFCYGGLRPKAKPYRERDHKNGTPKWCPLKRREGQNE